MISKSPQLVDTVATYVLAGSSVSFGLGSLPSPFGSGASAASQPAGAASSVGVARGGRPAAAAVVVLAARRDQQRARQAQDDQDPEHGRR